MIPLVLQKHNITRNYFILALVDSINASGGLHFGTIENPEDYQPGLQVSVEDIEIALPKARDNPYDNQWIEIGDDEPLRGVIFNDYDILTFKHLDDADYHIDKPEYIEQ